MELWGVKREFSGKLQNWYQINKRDLPWVGEKDPYRIWLSEIIMQQTRVEHGTAYYHKFCSEFPRITDLAKASGEKVLKMWEGLGYYSRAGNLHYTARVITTEFNGNFPDSFDELRKLKGIGDYTASAILSYAFGQPFAVVDTNVLRVISRYFGIQEGIDTNSGKKSIAQIAEKILDRQNPALHNQAMMDFSALVCKPVSPACNSCPFNKTCFAYKNELVDILPVKMKKKTRRERHFTFLVVTDDNDVIIQKRDSGDIWANLWQFPLIENEKELSVQKLKSEPEYINLSDESLVMEPELSGIYRQVLTHQKITGRFVKIKVNNLKKTARNNYAVIRKNDLKNFAFPGIIRLYLKDFFKFNL